MWPDGYTIFSIFAHLQQCKFAKKIFLKNVQNVAKLTLKIAKVFLKFHLSGEISPNLIALYYLVSNYVAQNLIT